jgi:hypothetical protein
MSAPQPRISASRYNYMALCTRGGSALFDELFRSAGLRSPFEPSVLADSVREVETALRGQHA